MVKRSRTKDSATIYQRRSVRRWIEAVLAYAANVGEYNYGPAGTKQRRLSELGDSDECG